MLEHFKGEEAFVRKILDYQNQTENGKMVLTKFLDPHKREIIHDVIGQRAAIYEEGGFVGAENKRVIICPDYYEIVPEDFKIHVYEVGYSEKFDHLAHKDVLGALMHLGIERACIGDICKQPLAFAITAENSDYVVMALKKIKRSSIRLIPHDFSLTIVNDFKKKEFVATSLRLDKLISVMFGLSRAKAMDAIHMGSVKVNHKVIEQTDYLCNNNDIISFRRHGRVKLQVTARTTKAGNYIVEGLFYL